MKQLIFSIILLFTLTGFCQHFNGDYISLSTSYKDEQRSENNFREQTKFNISVAINKSLDDGRVVIQDPRLPNKLLIYKVISRESFVELDGQWMALYDVVADHLDSKKKQSLLFYTTDKDELNVMVSDALSSQMFFDLKKE